MFSGVLQVVLLIVATSVNGEGHRLLRPKRNHHLVYDNGRITYNGQNRQDLGYLFNADGSATRELTSRVHGSQNIHRACVYGRCTSSWAISGTSDFHL
ncbi:hypothetical protein BV898_17745 [Hypsibius exemplaris]|uniref:Secreted protein n=1 Tax=Hypsibius exemplaris TaxID=2072580 RepID=A0A9X6NFM5_HYPEX|nr:hypothetical protein BV898_17745 [Hypsibius exemplaris]